MVTAISLCGVNRKPLAFCLIAFACFVLANEPRFVLAQDDERPNESNKTDANLNAVSEIRVDMLIKPPTEIEALIRRGKVRLVTGGNAISNPSTLPTIGRLAGETRFTFRYRYDSHARWQIDKRRDNDSPAGPMVNIQVRFKSIALVATHDVWLKDPPPTERFWEDSVVRHEFDHVRISSDPRIEKQFLDAAKKIEVLRVPLSQIVGKSDRIENSKVQSLIESRMKQTLDNTTDYVRIRYRELDRLTEHGLRPLPDDAGLIEIP